MKLVFFDIDGTIWDGQRNIPESTIRAIRQLRKNGHKAFLCSGRARANINAPELFEIGFDGVVAACGNHVEMDGQILFENILSQDLVRLITDTIFQCNMPVVYEGPEKHWISPTGFENDPYVQYLFKSLGDKAILLKEYKDDIRINKFSCGILPDTDYDRVKEVLDPYMDRFQHDSRVAEFVLKGTSKATGIKWLCDYLKVPVSDTYALGDSINDVDMLKFAGHGICMGNGTEPAREASEYITTDIHDNGIENALKHYGLI